jgi:hypothetical protein
MSKKKSITEQIEEMQEASNQLAEYEKLFNQACINKFGCNIKEIKEKIDETNSNSEILAFATIISDYYELSKKADYDSYISVMCSEDSKKYYTGKIAKKDSSSDDNVGDDTAEAQV